MGKRKGKKNKNFRDSLLSLTFCTCVCFILYQIKEPNISNVDKFLVEWGWLTHWAAQAEGEQRFIYWYDLFSLMLHASDYAVYAGASHSQLVHLVSAHCSITASFKQWSERAPKCKAPKTGKSICWAMFVLRVYFNYGYFNYMLILLLFDLCLSAKCLSFFKEWITQTCIHKQRQGTFLACMHKSCLAMKCV